MEPQNRDGKDECNGAYFKECEHEQNGPVPRGLKFLREDHDGTPRLIASQAMSSPAPF